MKHIKTFESFSLNEEEGSFRKFFTGHESSEARDKAMMDFMKALDEAEMEVSKNPSDYVFNRKSLEERAKDNNYKGGIRIQRGGGRDKRYYVVYDGGVSGFQSLAAAAGTGRRELGF